MKVISKAFFFAIILLLLISTPETVLSQNASQISATKSSPSVDSQVLSANNGSAGSTSVPPTELSQGVTASEPAGEEFEKVKRMVNDGIGAYPKKVLVLENLGDNTLPTLPELNFTQDDSIAYFNWSNSKQLSWDLKLNYRRAKKSGGVELAFNLTEADLVVHAPKESTWTLYRRGKKNTLEKLVERDPSGQYDVKNLTNWLFGSLGWDGVVIGQKDGTLIVGSTSEILSQEGLQALSVNFSNGKWVIPESERKGSGILSLTRHSGPFGFFDIVFVGSGVKSIPIGTKLIIEKKK